MDKQLKVINGTFLRGEAIERTKNKKDIFILWVEATEIDDQNGKYELVWKSWQKRYDANFRVPKCHLCDIDFS